MKIPKPLIKAIDRLPVSAVSIGYSGIVLLNSADLPANQVGYRTHGQTGASLVGSKPSDWRDAWFVIGSDSMCGDPFIVDTAQQALPVMTAMHGQGEWNPEIIATSLVGFAEAVALLARLAKGRESPVALQSNPVSQAERRAFLDQVRKVTGLNAPYWSQLTRQ
jgi:hypothetical protein